MDNTYYFAVNAMIDNKKQTQSGLVIAPNLASAAQRITNRFSMHDLTDIEITKKSEGVELFLYGEGFQPKTKIAEEAPVEIKPGANVSTCCGDKNCHCQSSKNKNKKVDFTSKYGRADAQFADLTSILNDLFSNELNY